MSGFSTSILIPAINHVLSREPWAMERLAPFSGRKALISASPLTFWFSIASDGTLLACEATNDEPAVSLLLPPEALTHALTGNLSRVLSTTTISGSADFAEGLSFVFKNLRWDIEADLSDFIGEIPASRGMQALRHSFAWQQRALLSLAGNAKDYLVDESRQVLSKDEIENFNQAISDLRDDLARLERRVAKL